MSTPLTQKQDVSTLEKAESINFLDFTELTSFCPNCKCLESLLFNEGNLIGQRKYKQYNGNIYHDSGSDNPCYLLA